MTKYKVIYDRANCIGANSCVGVLPDYWSLDGEKKAVLKDSSYNKETNRYELLIDEKDLEKFRESAVVCPVLVIDIVDIETQKSILDLPKGAEVEKESAPVIRAQSENTASVPPDPKGFFSIKLNQETHTIKAYYYSPKHQLLFVIEGKNAREIYLTIVKENFVSSLSYAAYLGSELQKAEIALKKNIPYTQDTQDSA